MEIPDYLCGKLGKLYNDYYWKVIVYFDDFSVIWYSRVGYQRMYLLLQKWVFNISFEPYLQPTD